MKITNIYAVGRNYAAHAQEMGNKVLKEPIFFQKSSASLSDDSVITLPRGREIHHELEIVTSIGKGGNNIQVDDAWTHVDGLCLGLVVGSGVDDRHIAATGGPHDECAGSVVGEAGGVVGDDASNKG